MEILDVKARVTDCRDVPIMLNQETPSKQSMNSLSKYPISSKDTSQTNTTTHSNQYLPVLKPTTAQKIVQIHELRNRVPERFVSKLVSISSPISNTTVEPTLTFKSLTSNTTTAQKKLFTLTPSQLNLFKHTTTNPQHYAKTEDTYTVITHVVD